MTSSIDTTYGALLLGGFCAAALSGIVVVQTFLYIKLFPRDSKRVKVMVAVVWTLDTTHSLLLYTSIWIFLISNYGNETAIEKIPIPLALTGVTTAVLTFIVHCSFSYRIHKLCPRRWQFTVLILVLAFFRLCCASVSTFEMIRVKNFTAFKAQFGWIFTLGLAMSCLVDILITGFLTHSLYALQRASTSLDRIIGAVVVYVFETNLLTSAATSVSMICWLAMPNNLIFLGLHFFISKLYANSLLTTLNTRQHLRDQRQRDASSTDLPGCARFPTIPPRKPTGKLTPRNESATPTKFEITVEKTVEFGDDSLQSLSIIEP